MRRLRLDLALPAHEHALGHRVAPIMGQVDTHNRLVPMLDRPAGVAAMSDRQMVLLANGQLLGDLLLGRTNSLLMSIDIAKCAAILLDDPAGRPSMSPRAL